MTNMVCSTDMAAWDEVTLNKFMWENSDQMIRRKLLKKYNLHYQYWIDYSVLTSIFAMIGLIIATVEWEVLYPKRETELILEEATVFSSTIIMITSILGVVAIVIKYRMEATWRNFNNPMSFYRRILSKQVNMGLAQNESNRTDAV